MYTLYWHPNSSSFAPMAVLEELRVPYKLHEVDYDGGETRSSEYLRLQPLGLIPALEIEGGRPMFESAAIILYLCDRHEAESLAPRHHEEGRQTFLQWLFFLADTLYPSYNRYYHPERYTSIKEGSAGVKEEALKAALRQWAVVEQAVSANGPWLLGTRFSACDIYLQMITTWHEEPHDLLAKFPRIREVAKGVLKRDACRRAITKHDFKTGFEAS